MNRHPLVAASLLLGMTMVGDKLTGYGRDVRKDNSAKNEKTGNRKALAEKAARRRARHNGE